MNTKKVVASAVIAFTLMQAPSAFAANLLQYGVRGQAVYDLQKELHNMGYNTGGIDGIFGLATKNAVLSFQRAHNLSADGIVGPMTEAKLNGTGSVTSSYSSILREGSIGSQVLSLQQQLVELGYNTGGLDGIFGPATKNAVMQLQRKYGISTDGVVGPQTYAVLSSARGNSVTSRGSYDRSVGYSIVNTAKNYIGASGYDCSGFVQHVYGEQGISLGRDTYHQINEGTPVTSLQPGDILFFSTSHNGVPQHEGIYIGNNEMIHVSSSSGDRVIVANLTWFYNNYQYLGARRF